MTEGTFEKLTWLAKQTGYSRSLILKQAIWLRYSLTHDRENVCADGHQCLCRDQRKFPESLEAKEEKEGI